MLNIEGVVESFLRDEFGDDDKKGKLRDYQRGNLDDIQRKYSDPKNEEVDANKAFNMILSELAKEGVRLKGSQERALRAALESNGLK